MTLRKAAFMGTPTSNGGMVTAATGKLINGMAVATIGDMALCPVCMGSFPIKAKKTLPVTLPNGKQIALQDDEVACGCPGKPKLLAGAGTLSVEG